MATVPALVSRVLLLVLSIGLCLVAAELAVRFIGSTTEEVSAGNELINTRILEPDPDTMIRLRSHIDVPMELFWPDWPVHIRTNATGQRMDRRLPPSPDPRFYRIATLGDSSTMGWGVDVEDAYPEVLARLLARNASNVEILNFGTVGFSSHNGVAQLEHDVLALRPDLVTLAFGFNDWSEQPGSDAERHAQMRRDQARRSSSWVVGPVTRRLQSLELARRLEVFWFPSPPMAMSKRVPLTQYRRNLEQMIRLSRGAGADVVLIDLDIPNSYGRAVLQALAEEARVPLVDVRSQLERRLGESQPEALSSKLDDREAHATGTGGTRRVLFRAYSPASQPKPVLVRPPHDELFIAPRDALELYDDGSHGDQVAGDRVFSRLAPWDPGRPDYAYPFETLLDSGGLQRGFMALFYHRLDGKERGGRVHDPPVRRVADVPLRPFLIPWDVVHPNARGHRVVAQALAQVVRELDAFETFRARKENRPEPREWFERRQRFFRR